MTRKEDLEGHIRDSYNLILEYEEILRTSDRPKEKARARRNIKEQWELVEGYLDEYLLLCQRMGSPIASDIYDITVRFEDVIEERILPKNEEPPTRIEQGGKYSIHIDHAEGLAIGDGARVEAPRVDIVGDGNVVGDGSSSHVVKGSTHATRVPGHLRYESRVPTPIDAFVGKFHKFWTELPRDPLTRDIPSDFEYDDEVSYLPDSRVFEDVEVRADEVSKVEIFKLSTHAGGATVKMIRTGAAGNDTTVQVFTSGRLITPNSFKYLLKWLESVSATVTLRGDIYPNSTTQEPPGPIQNRWALLVGVNRYVDPAFPLLKFCVNDVLALDATLKDLGYTVVTLHDDAAEERLRPTRDNVEAELTRLCQVAGPDDLLFVHFACHGKLVDGEPMLITRETRAPTLARRALPLSDVERQMRESEARRLVLTLDACHTGVEIGRDLADPEFIRNAYELAEGFALIAASTAQQIAQEWAEEEHGVFTYYLLEGLSGQADHDDKNFVTVGDLSLHVLNGLKHWNVEHARLLQEPTARTEGLGDIIVADYRE
jgi:hypothetical protein